MFTYTKQIVLLSLLLGLVVFLYACDTDSEMKEPSHRGLTTFQLLLDSANLRRSEIEKIDYDSVSELAYNRDFVFYDLSDIMMSPTDVWRVRGGVSTEEAIEDVNVLFEVLRYVYGGYQHFGGDEIFLPIKDVIIEEINQTGNSITAIEFFVILYMNLRPIIMDGHFQIWGHPFAPEHNFFSSNDIFIKRTDRGFFNSTNGQYIASIVGHEISDVLISQLDESGRQFYAPVLSYKGSTTVSQSVEVVYMDGTSEYVKLEAVLQNAVVFEAPTSLIHIEGYPIVSLAWMMGMSAEPFGHYAHEFLSYAKQLRYEPIVILDLRSNMGGCPALPLKWMYLLVGEVVRENSVSLSNWNINYEYPWEPYGGTPETNPFYLSYEDFENLQFLTLSTDINGFGVTNLVERQILERDQILIVLVDRHTSSAGELFVDLAFNVENTLVIGQNTAGRLLVDGSYPLLQLPNSRLDFSLGRTLMLHPYSHFTEGMGFSPDVWVTGDALEAVIAMLTNG